MADHQCEECGEDFDDEEDEFCFVDEDQCLCSFCNSEID